MVKLVAGNDMIVIVPTIASASSDSKRRKYSIQSEAKIFHIRNHIISKRRRSDPERLYATNFRLTGDRFVIERDRLCLTLGRLLLNLMKRKDSFTPLLALHGGPVLA